jgi:glyoxylase-like metal-dependent hydrolase (beta-lactamase superfamily II)
MEEVTPHVYSLDVKIDWFPQPFPPNVHLIKDGSEGALIDAGFPDDESFNTRMEWLRSIPDLNLKYIVITHHHFDHSSGAAKLREATGAKIVMHKLEEPILKRSAAEEIPSDMDVPKAPADDDAAKERDEWVKRTAQWRKEAAEAGADELVDDNDTLSIGGLTLRMVHSPGHTAGHLSPFLEEGKVLFAGDNVLGMGTTVVPPPPHGDMFDYIASLKKMQGLNADLMCCGHGPVVREPNRKLQELVDHRQEREEQILVLVGDGHDTVKSLVKAIYPELDKRIIGMATSQVLSHLSKLEREGKAKTDGKGADTKVSV